MLLTNTRSTTISRSINLFNITDMGLFQNKGEQLMNDPLSPPSVPHGCPSLIAACTSRSNLDISKLSIDEIVKALPPIAEHQARSRRLRRLPDYAHNPRD